MKPKIKSAVIQTHGKREIGSHPTMSSTTGKNTDSGEDKNKIMYLTAASAIHGKSEYIEL